MVSKQVNSRPSFLLSFLCQVAVQFFSVMKNKIQIQQRSFKLKRMTNVFFPLVSYKKPANDMGILRRFYCPTASVTHRFTVRVRLVHYCSCILRRPDMSPCDCFLNTGNFQIFM